MALLQWRRFNFFDKEFLKDHETGQALYEKLKDINITACSSGRGQMIFGDGNGNIYFLDRDLQLSSFKAFEINVSHLYQLKQHNILVSIGEDEVGINPLVRVWNLDKMDKLGNPICCKMLRAIPGNKPVEVTCLAVLENLTQMTIGFADGSVVIYHGDVTRDRHSKQRIVHQDLHPITGLSYKQTTSSTILFVVTSQSVMSFNVSAKDKKEALDSHGCAMHCSVLSDSSQEQQIIIARNEALYFYQADGRGPCLAFEGRHRVDFV